MQHQLSKSLVSSSEIARLYHEDADGMKEAVEKYIKYGWTVHADIFDKLLRCALLALVPAYKKYFYSVHGKMLRDSQPHAEDVPETSVTVIQSVMRMKIAKSVASKLKNKLQQNHEAEVEARKQYEALFAQEEQ